VTSLKTVSFSGTTLLREL